MVYVLWVRDCVIVLESVIKVECVVVVDYVFFSMLLSQNRNRKHTLE